MQRASKSATNFVEADKIRDFVHRIEGFHTLLLSEREAYMKRGRILRDGIALVMDEAAKAGVPKQSLRAVIKTRDLRLKAAAQRADLADIDHQDKFDLLMEALGDFATLPLGIAAMEAAGVGNGASVAA